MIDLFEQLARLAETSSAGNFMRASRYGYAAVSATHIIGIILLLGPTILLDLKLLGLWPRADRMSILIAVMPVAATGFVIVLASGFLLFSAQATDYVKLPIFQIKMGILILGILSALILHLKYGIKFERAPFGKRIYFSALSICLWISGVFAGRLIAFSAV